MGSNTETIPRIYLHLPVETNRKQFDQSAKAKKTLIKVVVQQLNNYVCVCFVSGWALGLRMGAR